MQPAVIVGVGEPDGSIFGVELRVCEEAGVAAEDGQYGEEEGDHKPVRREAGVGGEFGLKAVEGDKLFAKTSRQSPWLHEASSQVQSDDV